MLHEIQGGARLLIAHDFYMINSTPRRQWSKFVCNLSVTGHPASPTPRVRLNPLPPQHQTAYTCLVTLFSVCTSHIKSCMTTHGGRRKWQKKLHARSKVVRLKPVPARSPLSQHSLQDALRMFFQPIKNGDAHLNFYTMYKKEATEYDTNYIKKYDDDLNTTLIFMRCRTWG